MNKNSIDKEIIHIIDTLIIDTACYQPVELLLQLNLLSYAQYEQWCLGKTRYLSDNFRSNKEQVISKLDKAAFYAQSIKLSPESLTLLQWQQDTQQKKADLQLKFCPDNSDFSNKLDMQYLRKENQCQMDLFFDNQSIEVIKLLKQALISRNIRTASKHLQELNQTAPEHEFFQPASQLLDALINAMEQEVISEATKEMHYLLDELSPLAEKTLAGQERDYMAFFWRRLASSIDDTDYNEAKKNKHSSFCYQQIPDWQAVIKSIISTEDQQNKFYLKQPVLLNRLCLAYNKSGEHKNATQNLCYSCWQFSTPPDKSLLLNDSHLKRNYHAFLDHELDKQWGLQSFPTWLLIKEPTMSHYIKPDKQTPPAFTALQQLIQTELHNKEPSIKLRKQLKQIHPDVLAFYLKS